MNLLFVVLAAWPPWQQPEPSINEILAKVHANTGEFVRSLPDFICDETITSRALVRGRLRTFVNQSHFVGRQQQHGMFPFTETREVISINGKTVRPHTPLQGVLLFGGGFSSLLNETFGQPSAEHTYRLAGEERIRDRSALVLEFATRDGQKTLSFDFYGKAYLERDTGEAWIDKQSLRVLRLERHYLNVPKGETPIVATVDYDEVRIGDQPFWMPVSVQAGQAKGRFGEQAQYLAEYRNYRKFEASSSIVY